MIVKLLTEHQLEFLSLKGGCRGSSESTLVKMSNCWKFHVAAQFCLSKLVVLFQQTDIAGNCDTSYTTGEDGWYSKTIKKTKNLLSCTERNGYRTSIQGIPYAADSVSHLGMGFLTIMNG